MKKKRWFGALCLAMALVLMTGCTGKQDSGENTNEPAQEEQGEFTPLTVTDAMGRENTIDKQVEKVVCVGPGALRMYVYINGTEKLLGVEDIDKKPAVDKTYLTANPQLMELPSIGQGGPMNPPDIEKLVELGADVIFSTYAADAKEADEMQEKTGAKVFVLSNGKMTVFEEELYNSLKLIGDIMGKQERAEEVIGFMQAIHKDLSDRTKDVEPKTAYVGGIGFKGARGLLSTRAKFNLFQAVNVKGYVDDIGEKGPIMLDKEKMLEIDPEIIFFDLNGSEVAKKEYQEDPTFFDSLRAIKENKMYGMLSYNNYATNVDTAMLDAYYIGKIMYPEKFEDVEIAKQAESIYTTLLGKDVYPELMAAQDGYKEYSFK